MGKGDEFTVELSGRQYTIVIDKVETIKTYGNIDIHPDVTPTTGDAVLSQQAVLLASRRLLMMTHDVLVTTWNLSVVDYTSPTIRSTLLYLHLKLP